MLVSEIAEPLRRALHDGHPPSFESVLQLVLGRLRADLGMIHRFNAEAGRLELVASSAGIPEPVLEASRRIPLGKGIAGEAVRSKKPVSLCNLQTDASGVARPGAKATGAQGSLCVPVFLGDEVVGTLGVGVRGEREFTAAETEELLEIGRALAPPLSRLRG